MRNPWLCVPLVALVFMALRASAIEPVPAPGNAGKTVTIVTQASNGEVRDYKVDFQIKGAQPALSAAASYKIRHTYGKRVGDEPLAMEITLLQGQFTAQGQTLEVAPGLYPKLTILIEDNWRISDVFGASGSRFAQGTPGINYGNLIILFYLPDGDKPHTIGAPWQSRIKLPSLEETYDITNTINGIEMVDGVETAKVSEKIKRVPQTPGGTCPYTKCTTESFYSLRNGRLLKSHSECDVELPPDDTTSSSPSQNKKDTAPERVTVRIDISLAK